jgi:hypothetical protein
MRQTAVTSAPVLNRYLGQVITVDLIAPLLEQREIDRLVRAVGERIARDLMNKIDAAFARALSIPASAWETGSSRSLARSSSTS